MLAIGVAGCSSEEPGATDDAGSAALDPAEPVYPLIDRLEAALGVDIVDVREQTLTARLDFTNRCLEARGLDGGGLAWLPQPDSARQPQSSYYEPYSSAALAQLDPPTAASGDERAGIEPSEALTSASTECYEEAAADIPDPLQGYVRWMVTIMEEVDGRVAADPGVTAAYDDFRDCLRRHGFEASDEAEIQNGYAATVSSIQSDLIAGAISASTARADLEAVEVEELVAARAVNDCVAEREAAVQRVRAPIEDAILDQNASVFSQEAERVREQLRATED